MDRASIFLNDVASRRSSNRTSGSTQPKSIPADFIQTATDYTQRLERVNRTEALASPLKRRDVRQTQIEHLHRYCTYNNVILGSVPQFVALVDVWEDDARRAAEMIPREIKKAFLERYLALMGGLGELRDDCQEHLRFGGPLPVMAELLEGALKALGGDKDRDADSEALVNQILR
ncbi:MAG: hypothetical protein M1827_005605 [Pycnora praestabilis]|nr:MAG: hypothetical protein M1827_005605 [Pycnora praestabilis]